MLMMIFFVRESGLPNRIFLDVDSGTVGNLFWDQYKYYTHGRLKARLATSSLVWGIGFENKIMLVLSVPQKDKRLNGALVKIQE